MGLARAGIAKAPGEGSYPSRGPRTASTGRAG
jgi:hypothetical protein